MTKYPFMLDPKHCYDAYWIKVIKGG